MTRREQLRQFGVVASIAVFAAWCYFGFWVANGVEGLRLFIADYRKAKESSK